MSAARFDYDAGWETRWDDMKKHGPMSRHVRRLIRAMVEGLEFGSVLDVGCGQGSLLEELSAEHPGVRLEGVDVSSAALEQARLKSPSGHFRSLDIEKECLESQFDLVICSEVLEHLPDDRAALRHLAGMAGRFLLVVTLQGRMRRFEAGEVGHVRNYAPGELAAKVRETGLSVRRVMEWGYPFYSPLYRDFLEVVGGRGTTGRFRWPQKLASSALYSLFLLNSARRGDEILVLAERLGGTG